MGSVEADAQVLSVQSNGIRDDRERVSKSRPDHQRSRHDRTHERRFCGWTMQLLEPQMIKHLHRQARLILCIWLLGACGCDRPAASQAPAASMPGMIVLPGALNVRKSPENQRVVTYEVKEAHPAMNAISTITEALEDSGWRRLQEDILNPGLPLSFSRGWVEYEDVSAAKSKYVYQWSGQWEDNLGQVAWYILTLEGAPTGQGTYRPAGHLRVRAILLPAEEVARIRRNTTSAKPQ